MKTITHEVEERCELRAGLQENSKLHNTHMIEDCTCVCYKSCEDICDLHTRYHICTMVTFQTC